MTTIGMRWPLRDKEGGEGKGAGGGGSDTKAAGTGGADGLGTIEDQAKRMGWSPKEEFRGAPEKWTEADVFLKNGMESLPILRERNRTMQRTIDDLSKSVAEFKKMSDTAFERGYAKSKKDLQTEIKAAAKTGDEVGAAAAADQLAALEREKAERKQASDKDPVFDGWVAENPWYADADMQIEAEAMGLRLRKRMEAGKEPKLEGLPFLERVKEDLKKSFPDKFGNPRRQQGSGVERSSAGGEDTASRGKKGWDSLPSDAKEAGERYVKQKLYKDKAAYAAAYWDQN